MMSALWTLAERNVLIRLLKKRLLRGISNVGFILWSVKLEFVIFYRPGDAIYLFKDNFKPREHCSVFDLGFYSHFGRKQCFSFL